jgi:hypothetical protein
LDAVPFVMICNLANINAAIRRAAGVIELRLMCVGAGPALDFEDATFLAGSRP